VPFFCFVSFCVAFVFGLVCLLLVVLLSSFRYVSHETGTHASPATSCAASEVGALRDCFGGALLQRLVLVNTKGATGHAMGCGFEDVACVEMLSRQRLPPSPNGAAPDPLLGPGVVLSPGGPRRLDYCLRFAAGFGSQVCFALYARA
jgi:3-oxoacyl-(acyl-carrier-protein) synthase